MHVNWLEWPMDRGQHSFHAYVVEPRDYKPETHTTIFREVLSRILSPPTTMIDSYSQASMAPAPEPFDLATFPEAFLTPEGLLQFLDALAGSPVLMGCVHVGLRATAQTYLFSIVQLGELVAKLRGMKNIVPDDFDSIRMWLDARAGDRGLFNAGCLFAVDRERRLRICVHLKNVRSTYEINIDPALHMSEACLLSLVSLKPSNRQIDTVVLQPLICSDVLDESTDAPGAHPIGAVTTGEAVKPDGSVVEWVDVVSAAVCSPQMTCRELGKKRRRWRDRFLNSFMRAATNDTWQRHRHAAIVLSNYRKVPVGAREAGLSGIFLPMPHEPVQREGLIVDVYARPEKRGPREEEWLSAEAYVKRKKGPVMGQIMSLSPEGRSADATVLGFTIGRLPRDAARRGHNGKIVDVRSFDITVTS